MARPSKYKDDYPDQVERLALLGLTDEEMAKFFDIAVSTFNKWKKDYPEFSESIKKGKQFADAKVAESLFKRACGYSHPAVKIMQYEGVPVEVEYTEQYPPDTTACLAWLHNRQREKWQRNPDPNGGLQDLPPTKVVFEVKDARVRERG